MRNLKNFLFVLIIQVIVYVVLFIGFSFLWRKIGIDSNISFVIVVFISLFIYTFVYYKVNFKFYNWFFGILPMWILSTVYHPHNLF